ncbi:MAG: xanthine dehydrogenase molybdopterin binding subunit [Sphingobacteriia bacterium]|nr:xanthine dehydrogenase molybdopterin binding subunit [Sphingobacteriia bacterium]
MEKNTLPHHHESAVAHVTGKAVYINDMAAGGELLHGRVVYSSQAHARIKSIGTEKAGKLPGVKAILTAKDIPGVNQMGPVAHDEPCLALDEVNFTGQAVVLIAAVDEETAIKAARLIEIEYTPLPAILTIEKAMEADFRLSETRKIQTGDPEKVFRTAQNVISGKLKTGAQEHWYLETQSCLSVPGENDEMQVFSSTQHPSETQAIVAEVLGIRRNQVTVEIRRMGGAFGGKETQANHVAAWASLLACKTRQPVKIHLFRDDDQIMTGKRHRFLSSYKAAFDDSGKIIAIDASLNSDGGAALDLSVAIMERALFHIDNAYFIPNLKVIGTVWRTNLPPNTAFRGFGGPQGMAVVETVIDRIARTLKKDAAVVRKLNFYQQKKNNFTHYGQKVEANHLGRLYQLILRKSKYGDLRKEVNSYNERHEFYKKGLALTPVKFGISFTTTFLNQAGALVNIYQDGTVLVNHGGTEMGQGLHTKIMDITSAELGITLDRIRISPTNTSKVPNTSATAASSGSDLNGMAVKNAIDKLKKRLGPVAITIISQLHGIRPDRNRLIFNNNHVFDKNYPEAKISFETLVKKAYLAQISLSATGFYKTPDLHFDREAGRGKPFHYFACGMAVSEVLLDTLTGYHQILKTFIIHDTGSSINEQVDTGQVEGGFVQGIGWCTTEDVKWDAGGRLLNHSPDTYKIPGIRDIPQVFNVELLNIPNPKVIRHSKAVGEPPFMLAFSVWLAIKDAVSAVGNHGIEPEFQIPATNEVILQSIEKIKKKQRSG